MWRFTFIFLITILLQGLSVQAQTLDPDAEILLVPNNPKPGERVTARLQSFGINLSQSIITWKYNNTTIESGAGKTSITITAPSATTPATLSAVATSIEGTAQASITILPASVDILWEAVDAYTPPFYKGKALAPTQGVIKVTAIPHSNAPKTLTYQWQQNNSALQTLSGVNKNSITIRADELNSEERFSVSTSGYGFSGSNNVTIPTRDPDIVAYTKKEGFIDFSKGVTKNILTPNTGISLFFAPFNFSVPQSINNDLDINISTGENDITNLQQKNQVVVTTPTEGGDGQLSVIIQSVKKRLQRAARTFTLSPY